MISRDDLVVIRAVKQAIGQLQTIGVAYADLYSPLHDDGISDAMRRLSILERPEPLGQDIVEVVSPPVFGRYLLQYSTDVSRDQQRFARCHGMGHVVAGHVAEVSYLSRSGEWRAHEERVCDTFALADLVPAWQLEVLVKMEIGWRAIKHDLVRDLRQHTVDWPDDRIEDRAHLRVALYQHFTL